MAIIDDINKLAPVANAPPQEQSSWVKDLISQRYAPKTERLKRTPKGFDFKREPFDPSSYYRSLGTFRDVSRAVTSITKTEAANKRASEIAAQNEEDRQAMLDAMGGVNPNFTYGDGNSRKYGLKGVTTNTARAADYFGSRFGINSIGGYREHGSVPGSDHPKGRALDFMTNNKSRGTSLANDVIKNYKRWHVKYVIWNRYIWSPGRGWRKYNGPSPHTDHVHVSFNK